MDITTLAGQDLLIVGGGSGIARALAADAVAEGATVTLAGRDPQRLAPVADAVGAATARIDLTDEASIAAFAATSGPLDHVVSLAAAPANGPVGELDRDAVHTAFDAKVVGPLLLAKHLAPLVRGSFLLFSGVAAWRPAPGRSVMATTNGAVAFLAEALAVELAPVRVNALSPGIVDSGQWDRLGDGKDAFLAATAAANPARRTGTPAQLSAAARSLLTNPFVTGTTLHVDGGGRLA
ncbi:Short chain dehydrogenase [Pseudonocardia sp. Ae406_Ps2]|uniref:SDR family oxidoreductase n=1 Tax=unclassified Pseudonocardia TaxID=2619320 RepID=UPI00094ADC06|nr:MULTISPECIES: SDR family oxidoreductase [unclassified Pseudonocardia]OLL96764.1 Short chain dehydrogenase [Pseudonocardia sp. Ae331_Ps2]OLM05525.1 Short chain dehydrogenase [Pseudonocardia sp. Ae406_Ps2]OLM15527.1 Short chain dehydrogenase [Pseudonocardia sp. Ae505_Ps2]OLM27096.1 Short chain dehydrogenase [Pseudonocardia sp. Ae706_Ps2]OLM32792.1 Short chain dehydrogenase [Pseudonocardia sp. Ae717_Ps2]